MWSNCVQFLSTLKPSDGERILFVCGGVSGWICSVALGGVTDAMRWLAVFCAIDYVLGTVAAWKLKQWNSKTGFAGIFKKVFMFLMIMLANGIDSVTGAHYIRDMVVMAYLVNEAGSLLENVEKLGYGKLIPGVLKAGLEQIKEKEKELLKGGLKK